MRKKISLERYPLPRIGTRLLGKPVHLFRTIIRLLIRMPTQKGQLCGQAKALMLDRGEGRKWMKSSVLVNSVNVFRHNIEIIAPRVVGPRRCGGLDFAQLGCADLSQPEIWKIWRIFGFPVVQLQFLGSTEIVRFFPFRMARNSLPKTVTNDAEGLILLGMLQAAGQAILLSRPTLPLWK